MARQASIKTHTVVLNWMTLHRGPAAGPAGDFALPPPVGSSLFLSPWALDRNNWQILRVYKKPFSPAENPFFFFLDRPGAVSYTTDR